MKKKFWLLLAMVLSVLFLVACGEIQIKNQMQEQEEKEIH